MRTLLRSLLFLLQAVVVGLAIAFVLVYFRPGLLTGDMTRSPADSYAAAVDASSPSVVNVHSARRTEIPGPGMWFTKTTVQNKRRPL